MMLSISTILNRETGDQNEFAYAKWAKFTEYEIYACDLALRQNVDVDERFMNGNERDEICILHQSLC